MSNREAVIRDYLKTDDRIIFWDIAIRGDLYDWEVEEITELSGHLYAFPRIGDERDAIQ